MPPTHSPHTPLRHSTRRTKSLSHNGDPMCQAPRMKQSSHVLSTKDDIVIPCAIHHWNQYRRTLC